MNNDLVSREAVEQIFSKMWFTVRQNQNLTDEEVKQIITKGRMELNRLPSSKAEFAKDLNVTHTDFVDRQAAIEAVYTRIKQIGYDNDPLVLSIRQSIRELPSAQPEYEPVKAEDFAKTMSENTIYSFIAWHGEALELMEKHGFVICKKTM